MNEYKDFEEKSLREISLWEWLARILPLTVLAAVVILYFFKWHSALELLLEITAISFAAVCFIWWFWALKKIARTIKYMSNTQESLKEVLIQFKLLKKDLKDERDLNDR
jgi:tellurite resistance protein TehA-like permease